MSILKPELNDKSTERTAFKIDFIAKMFLR